MENGCYADDNFFSSFTFPLLKADGQNVLKELNSIVISEAMALRFFNNTDCIGKILVYKLDNREESFKITGVFKNIPFQSILQFNFVIPFQKYLADHKGALETGASATSVWALLKENADKEQINAKISGLIKNQESTLNQELFLFPMKEKVLYSYSGKQRERGWTPWMNSLVIISCVGSLILLIACFNFLNLAIALTIKRYREAGIKKIVGSKNLSIVIQFLMEAWILAFSSLLMAVLLAKLLLPGLNTLFNLHLQLTGSDYKIILLLILITFITGLISGLLPALYLASSNPLNVLKGKIVTGHSYSIFRQGLIVFQFTVPIILIVMMMIIKIQSNYMLKCDIGVERDNLIVVNTSKIISSHSENVRSELLAIPGIDAVSFSNCIPTMGAAVTNDILYEGKDDSEKLHFWCIDTDFDYFKTVKIQMTDGRFFNPSYSNDSNNYVINDITARILKIKKSTGLCSEGGWQKGYHHRGI